MADEQQQDQQQSTQDQQQQQQASIVSPDALSRSLTAAVEAINSLPDRVVDALRESGASTQQQQAGKNAAQGAVNDAKDQQPQQTVDQKAEKTTFTDFWFGKRS